MTLVEVCAAVTVTALAAAAAAQSVSALCKIAERTAVMREGLARDRFIARSFEAVCKRENPADAEAEWRLICSAFWPECDLSVTKTADGKISACWTTPDGCCSVTCAEPDGDEL